MSFWTQRICGIWFRKGRCTGSWPRTAAGSQMMFADLFGPRGRPSIPGPVIAAVMVLQALECLSDREAAFQRLRRAIAWKAAAGLSLAHGGFHPRCFCGGPGCVAATVLSVSSTRCAKLSIVAGCWLTDRRALDSTILTTRLLRKTRDDDPSQIRRCRRLIPQAADLVLVAHDYESSTKPSCDWSDPDWSLGVGGWFGRRRSSGDRSSQQRQVGSGTGRRCGSVGSGDRPDVEPDPDREGRWRIARRWRRTGPYRRWIHGVIRAGPANGTGTRPMAPETGLVTAAVLTAANTPDADLSSTKNPRMPSSRIRPTRRVLETFDHTPVVKPIVRKPHIKDGFHRTISISTPKDGQ